MHPIQPRLREFVEFLAETSNALTQILPDGHTFAYYVATGNDDVCGTAKCGKPVPPPHLFLQTYEHLTINCPSLEIDLRYVGGRVDPDKQLPAPCGWSMAVFRRGHVLRSHLFTLQFDTGGCVNARITCPRCGTHDTGYESLVMPDFYKVSALIQDILKIS